MWWDKPLDTLSASEWESLCDGCGKCCLHKIQDEYSGDVWLTAVACEFLDPDCVRCREYPRRAEVQPACMIITPTAFPGILPALPNTCAYRLRWENKPLPVWHPLLHGGKQTQMTRCGHSVRDRVIGIEKMQDPEDEDEWEALIIPEWSDNGS